METIKSVFGLGGSAAQSGEEPVSGKTGTGTAADPYDQGNAPGKCIVYVKLFSIRVPRSKIEN